jgi:hypothetical protein
MIKSESSEALATPVSNCCVCWRNTRKCRSSHHFAGGCGHGCVEHVSELARTAEVEVRGSGKRQSQGLRCGLLRHTQRCRDGAGAGPACRRRARDRPCRRFPHQQHVRSGASGTECSMPARSGWPRRSMDYRNTTGQPSATPIWSPTPGCYPTAVQLGFMPLLGAGLVELDHSGGGCQVGRLRCRPQGRDPCPLLGSSRQFQGLCRSRTPTSAGDPAGLVENGRRPRRLDLRTTPDAHDPGHSCNALRAHQA